MSETNKTDSERESVQLTEQNNTCFHAAPVASVLMAHSKDLRQYSLTSRRILAAILPFLTSCVTEEDVARNRTSLLVFSILPEIQFICNCFHTAIILLKTKQTVGMEALRLHHIRPKDSFYSLNMPVLSSSADNSNSSISNTEATTLYVAQRTLTSPWSSNPFRIFFFLYSTLLPYLLHRATTRRNGWSDFKKVMRLIYDKGILPLFWRHSSNPTEQLPTSSPSTPQREYDNLRGEDRKRIFYQMRQDMNHRVNRETEPCIKETVPLPPISSASSIPTNTRIQIIRNWMWYVTRQVALAMEDLIASTTSYRYSNPLSSIFPIEWGTHRTPLAHAEQQQQQQEMVPTDERSTLTSIIYWLLQLHLAMFYINGKYPTLFHRWTRTQMLIRLDTSLPPSSEKERNKNNVTVESPSHMISNESIPSYRFIGYLILLEGAVKLVQATVKKTVEVSTWLYQKNSSDGVGASIEATVPSFHSSSRRNSPVVSTGISSCAICFHDRVHPACPKSCGHVFCWECIQHWLLHVRMECPFCRAPTRPQDIVPLYHYEP